MKFLVLAFSVLLLPSYSYGQKIEWIVKSSLPYRIRNGSAVECKGKIYLMGGYCDSTSARYENFNFEYSIKDDTWTPRKAMLTVRSNFALVSDSQYIYAIGGDPFSDKNERYDPRTATWIALKPMKTPRQHVNGVLYNNRIYVIGGLMSIPGSNDMSQWSPRNMTNITEVYDIEKNEWKELSPMPSRRHNVSLVSIGNKLLAFGGMGDEKDMWKSLDTVEEYDIINDKWIAKGKMPQPRDGINVYTHKNKVFIVGGFSGSIITDSVLVYDVITNKWDISTKFPNKKNASAACAGVNNTFFVIGGCDTNYTANSNNFLGVIQ